MSQTRVQPKGMKWSQDALKKAQDKHQYIKVGTKAGTLTISGAPGRWKKAATSTDVYVPAFRVVGKPADILALLTSPAVGYKVSDVQDHIATAYSAQNYKGTHKENFDAEVRAYKAYRKLVDSKVKAGPTVTLRQLPYFVNNLKGAKEVARASSTTTTTSPGRGSRVKPIADRLAAVQKTGQVLDVSNMNIATGTNIKASKLPGATSKKIQVPGLAIVSSDPAKYAHVVKQLGSGYQKFIPAYNALYAKKHSSPAVPPVRSPTLPASRSPTLPTLPARSPVVGGLPTVPGLGGLPTTALPVASPSSPAL